MKPLALIPVILLLFTPALAGDAEVGPVTRGAAGETEATVETGGGESAEPRFIAYYFHRTRRCNTCRTIEAYAEEAIKSGFEEQLRTGTLEWKVVNLDEPENEHFVKDFSLSSSSLVIAEAGDHPPARHEVLQDVWILTRDKDKFLRYVREAVQKFLG